MGESEYGVVKLLVVIVDRGKGERAAELCQGRSLPFNTICLGQGTANSQILDYLGLGETRKDVVFSLMPERMAPELVAHIGEQLQLKLPGRGIVFSLPLSGLSRAVSEKLHREAGLSEPEGEKKQMEKESPSVQYDLIVAVVNHGYMETVMTAAKTAGARGGTVLHGRSTDGAEGVTGFAIQPEKEVVAILIPHGQKLAVMQAVHQAAGPATEGRGLLFSLPVEDIMGLR